jgi:hypothetical protein
VLFRSDLPDSKNDARVNVMGGHSQYVYPDGYLLGARYLVERIATPRDKNVLVYPIIFLYRHHIELVLKRLISRAPYLINRSLTDSEKKHLATHRLDYLWGDLKPMLSAIWEAAGWQKLDAQDIGGVDAYVSQLVEVDLKSFSFRYAQSKEGESSLPSDLKHINMRHFAEMMDRLANYLDDIDTATDCLKSGA